MPDMNFEIIYSRHVQRAKIGQVQEARYITIFDGYGCGDSSIGEWLMLSEELSNLERLSAFRASSSATDPTAALVPLVQ